MIPRMTPSDGAAELEQLLEEQAAYYRAAAPEYRDHVLPFPGEDELVGAVDAFQPAGDVLELACGPGTWTGRLLSHAQHVTAVDASAEMLALASARFDDERVRLVRADVFDWTPDLVAGRQVPRTGGAGTVRRRRLSDFRGARRGGVVPGHPSDARRRHPPPGGEDPLPAGRPRAATRAPRLGRPGHRGVRLVLLGRGQPPVVIGGARATPHDRGRHDEHGHEDGRAVARAARRRQS